MKNFNIYADYAATSKPWSSASDAIKKAMDMCWGNPSSQHAIGIDAKRAMNKASDTIRSALDAYCYEIAWTSGGTEANNFLIPFAMGSKPRRKIFVSPIEHSSVLMGCKVLSERGFEVHYLPISSDGSVDIKMCENLFDEDTLFCSAMLVNNETGSVSNIKELSKMAHNVGAIFHTDAVQAVGHIYFSVLDLDADMVSFSSHKFGGPKGCGGIIYKPNILSPLMFGGHQNNGIRPGTENIPGIISSAAAIEQQMIWMQNPTNQISQVMETFIYEISKDKRIMFNGFSKKNHVSHIINISVLGVDNSAIVSRLGTMGICVSGGSACNSGVEKVSHVLSVLDPTSRGGIRISFGPSNTEQDAYVIATEIIKISNSLMK